MLSIGLPIIIVVIAALVFLASYFLPKEFHGKVRLGGLGLLVPAIITFVLACVVTVPPGHAGVAVLFGKVQPISVSPGLHFANPFLDWTYYDCRQKTHKETAPVPSRDQLLTRIDVSVQYKIIPRMAPKILDETGDVADVIAIHLVPKLRSILRESGKTVERAEDFFLEDTQVRIQKALYDVLKENLTSKGLEVQAVLLRNIELPPTIRAGVISKKRRDQEAEKQKSELRRFETEQQQKVASAKAERQAAEEAAKMKRVLADAQAYEIMKINEAISTNPAYIKLEALKTLQAISKDQAAKIYFLNGDSPTPLPLMHIGDDVKTQGSVPVKQKR